MAGKLLFALAVLLLAACADAALNAVTDTRVVDMANCGPESGPATRIIQLSIANEWNEVMIVDYEYYDFTSNSWKDAGRLCAIPAKQLGKCQATLRVALGGKGSGTVTQDMLRLTGRNDESGLADSRTISFILNHYPGDREKARLAEIEGVRAKIGDVRASLNGTCGGEVCCGLADEREALQKAGSLLAGTDSLVSECRLTELYSTYVNASTELNRANSTDVIECKALLPLISEADSNRELARAAVRRGEACRANVLGAKELLAQYDEVFGNATAALASDDYATAGALLPEAAGLASRAEGAVGECGGQIWDRENMTDTELSPNTTGGISEYMEPEQAGAGEGGCVGMVALLGSIAFLALAKSGV